MVAMKSSDSVTSKSGKKYRSSCGQKATEAQSQTEENCVAASLNQLYACHQCDFYTCSKHAISTHIRSKHIELRPYTCSQCGFAARQKYSLVSHIRRKHDGEGDVLSNKPMTTAINERIKQMYSVKPDETLPCESAWTDEAEADEALRHALADDNFDLAVSYLDSSDAAWPEDAALPLQAVFTAENHPMIKFCQFACRFCCYGGRDLFHIKRHVLKYHTKCRPYRCAICSFAAVSGQVVSLHLRKSHSDSDQASVVVDRSLMSRLERILPQYFISSPAAGSLRRGGLQENSVGLHMACSGAQRRKANRRQQNATLPPPVIDVSRLNQLQNSIAAGDNYICKLCSYTCANVDIVQRHIRVRHNLLRPFKCSLCATVGSDRERIASHIRTFHKSDASAMVMCDESLAAEVDNFTQRCWTRASCVAAAVDLPADQFAGESYYECLLCAFRSTIEPLVQQHVVVEHVAEQPFVCKFCGFRSPVEGSVKMHIKDYHIGFPLRICVDQQSFAQQQAQLMVGYRFVECNTLTFLPPSASVNYSVVAKPSKRRRQN